MCKIVNASELKKIALEKKSNKDKKYGIWQVKSTFSAESKLMSDPIAVAGKKVLEEKIVCRY